MGFCNSGASITLAHTPLKAILLQGTIRSTFPQLWRVACHFKQILHYFEKQQGESKFAFFFFFKYVSDTCWLGGQCSCHYVLMTLFVLSCVGAIASGLLLSDTDTVVQRCITQALLPLSGTSFSTPCSISSCRVRLVDIFLSSSAINK